MNTQAAAVVALIDWAHGAPNLGKLLNLHYSTPYQWVRRGKLPNMVAVKMDQEGVMPLSLSRPDLAHMTSGRKSYAVQEKHVRKVLARMGG